MKIKIIMKDPDVFDDAIRDAVHLDMAAGVQGVDADEAKRLEDGRVEKICEDLAERWFEYGEYLRVEVDTEAHTIKVLPVK